MSSAPSDGIPPGRLHHRRVKPSDGSILWRSVIAIIFTLCLAVFIHLRHSHRELLPVGTVSQRYIVAQVPFEFIDRNAEMAAQQGAQALIGPIYQVDEHCLNDRIDKLEQYIAESSQDPDKFLPPLNDSGRAWVKQLQSRLLKLRFTDERTWQQIRELDPRLYPFFVVLPNESHRVPQEALNKQLQSIAPPAPPRVLQRYIVASLSSLPLVPDSSIERRLRASAVERISTPIMTIPAGAKIVDKDEVITWRHQAMMKAMEDSMRQARSLWSPMALLGSLIISTLLVILGAIFLNNRQPEMMRSTSQIALLVIILLMSMAGAKCLEILSAMTASTVSAVAGDLAGYPSFVPLAVVLLSVLIGPEVGLFGGTALAVLLALTLAAEPGRFLVLNLISVVIACVYSGAIRRRKDIFRIYWRIWLACIPYMWALQVGEGMLWSAAFGSELFGTALSLIITAVAVIGLLPLLEASFGILTDITLMEYMDPNHELLRRLTIEAPGTYQHSLMVATLAEAAANAIGANGLLCRVCSLYHDIGKLIGPHYFTENQHPGVNIHQMLTPLESAQVIIAHVSEGIVLGHKYRLPETFINIIREHHGTTLVYYFFCQQLDQVGGYTQLVCNEDFRYPGPKPQTRESAIIMIADSLEAASRSLEELTEGALLELADRLVQDKAEDGQFDRCNMTFEELGMVKRTMVKTLLVTAHTRIKYPKRLEDSKKGLPQL